MHRKELADFLRRRRAALQPSDVGLLPGTRRRTGGLRREEVAQLAGMSTDYYTRLEQQRGPQPSVQIAASLARALRLTSDERDYVFGLIGHHPPARYDPSSRVSPTLLRVMDRLDETPALVISDLSEVLAQNILSIALTKDQTRYSGLARSAYFRWFTDPAERLLYAEEDHPQLGRTHAARLRAALTTDNGNAGEAQRIVTELRQRSPEFVSHWERQEVAQAYDDRKSFIHHQLGRIDLDCESLYAENRAQTLLVLSARPGSESDTKLQQLARLASGI